jgi:hypothetical protein
MQTIVVFAVDLGLTGFVITAVVKLSGVLGKLFGDDDDDGGGGEPWRRPPQTPRGGPHAKRLGRPMRPTPSRPRTRR